MKEAKNSSGATDQESGFLALARRVLGQNRLCA